MKIKGILGKTVEVDIDAMTYGASGVGRLRLEESEDSSAWAVFVPYTIPGEKVRVRLEKQHKNFFEASLVEILVPSPDRITPECGVFEKCGGCQWQHIRYDRQTKLKKELLLHQLEKIGKIPKTEIADLVEIHPAPQAYGYRNRTQARFDDCGIGFFAKDSNAITYTDKCPILAHPLQKKWSQFLEQKRHLELFKNRRIKTNPFSKVEWTVVDSTQILESIDQPHAFAGFTQVNTEQNEVLKRIVKEEVLRLNSSSEEGTLLDLYGGSGNLSNPLKSHFSSVICVDTFNEGKHGLASTLQNGFSLIRETIEDFFSKNLVQKLKINKISAIIADPPREGLKATAQHIANLKSDVLVLVSCDPSTLARDLARILENYRIEKIFLVDMFPQTFHIETVVSFTPK